MDIQKLYIALRDRIMADPSIGIKHFALESDQNISEPEEDITFPKPALILTAEIFDPQSLGNGVQLSRVEFQLRLICETYSEASSRESSTIQNEALSHLSLLANVNKRVHRFSAEGIGTIGKTNTIIGSVAENIVEHVLNYRCTMKDESAIIELQSAEPSLVPVLDIPNIFNKPEPVKPPNQAPVGVADNYTTAYNTPIEMNVLANDSDPDFEAIDIASFTQPTSGNAVVTQQGQNLIYTPNSFVGEDTFTYIPTDDEGAEGESVIVTVTVNASTYLLDNHPAIIALDFFKLSSDYSGNANNIRESSGSAQLDIGFSDDNYNEADLLTHIGENDGFVAIKYNQSSANNFIQTSAGKQPQIANLGNIIKDSGLPTMQFGGSNALNSSAPVDLGSANELWLFMVVNITNISTAQMLYETSSTNVSNNGAFGIVIFSGELIVQQNNSGSRVQVACPITTGLKLLGIRLRGGQTDLDTTDIYIGGSAQSKTLNESNNSPASYSNYTHYLGSRNNSSIFFDGNIQMFALWTGNQSANRGNIESFITNNYTQLP